MNWIKVEDRLPEQQDGMDCSQDVVAWMGRDGWNEAYYDYESMLWWGRHNGYDYSGVTHWLEITPPVEVV